MSLREKMADFMNAMSHYLVATTPEAKKVACAVAADEFRTCLKLAVAEALKNGSNLIVPGDKSDVSK